MVHNVFYCVKSDEQLSRYGHQKCDCTFSVCPSAIVYWGGGRRDMGVLERFITLLLVCGCLSWLLF